MFNRNALLGYIIFLLVASNFFHHVDYSYKISNNGGKYLISAQQLVNSEQAETVSYYHSRFIYPFLLALSFKISEVSLDSAYLMTQFIFILTICALFWTASTLFGKWVAFFSCILIISTPTLMIISRSIDIIFLEALFILSSYTMFNTGWVKKQNIYFWISGLFMALACYTRESAWFFIIYPFLYYIFSPGSKNKIYLEKCLFYLASILIISLISAFYLAVLGESYWELFGALQPGGVGRVAMNSPTSINFFQYILKGFSGIISHGGEKFPLFPAMLISWGIILWSSLKRRNNKDRILIAMILPTIPFLFLYGSSYTYITERHIILFFLLSYVALFRSLQLIFRLN
ncbi:MAG: glycosyltransferase family 39 protein, partial [Candidatus Neomarinimicrobiota bacterium]|nr:glycosyltransferase family 39 protein [Candidatus Neomarinimicrobiota bacterium]